MAKQSSHTRWKGHCLMCADNKGKFKGLGDQYRTPFKELRKLGIKKRYSRNKAYGDEA